MTASYGFAPTEKILTPTTLAEMLEISERHLADLRREDDTFPAPVLLGTLPRWSPAVIRWWMEGLTTAPCCTCTCTCTANRHPGSPTVAATTKSQKKRKAAQRVH